MKKIFFMLGLISLLLCSMVVYADTPQKSIPTDSSVQPVAVLYIENADGTYSRVNSTTPLPMSVHTQGIALTRKESTQDLNTGVLSYTTDFAAETRVTQILFTASGAITQTVEFTFDSVTNATYDTVLASEDLVSGTDYVYIPDEDLILASGDEILITCTNSGTPSINVYVTVMGESLN